MRLGGPAACSAAGPCAAAVSQAMRYRAGLPLLLAANQRLHGRETRTTRRSPPSLPPPPRAPSCCIPACGAGAVRACKHTVRRSGGGKTVQRITGPTCSRCRAGRPPSWQESWGWGPIASSAQHQENACEITPGARKGVGRELDHC